MMENNLAIIIPAYKADFLDDALQSIANQTCKRFTLYIGDDCSPNNLYAIVCKYEGLIDIVYKKFAKNIGGYDLVGQWERCIDMVQEEEWLWLFSDDDIMTNNCVEEFYKYLDSDKEAQLLHFNVDIINEKGKCEKQGNLFPSRLSSLDFFRRRMEGEIFSFAVEYVFTRKLYFQNGKFQKFDLAWCSDDATWVKFARDFDILTINSSAKVYWRYSGQNISSLNVDESILLRKLNSKLEYLKWAINFFKDNRIALTYNRVSKIKWVLLDLKEFYYLPLLKRLNIAYRYGAKTGFFVDGLLGVLYVIYIEFKKRI
ncbi:glycosyltransferase family 2 protein [Flavobacterium zhairuonense]|uniref:glycosyltransferase family 2 protein n=1 Tax=Flavobacterium zhairuonense TaxID=2493631 RepID=UPI0010480FB9|nr:glycosyltransferase [Flavobacterium zhairuonense]KAF2509240.1 glycosyltransferase family 2 protein [Flavobacterium zhairuonense]